MLKLSLLPFLFLFSSIVAFSQKTPSDKEILDSLRKNDELMKMLDSLDNPTSYFKVNLSASNQLFSVKNKTLDALQSDNKLIISPSIGYFHKSGFGISFAAYLLSENSSTGFFQYSITPSYEYDKKNIEAGISYTRYFVKDPYGGETSPIKNDIYASFLYKKHWLNPGIAIGYSDGVYKEINTVTANLPVLGVRTFKDTATTKLNSFSLIGNLQHTFDFLGVISKKDLMSFSPSFMVNAGSSKFLTTHQNQYNSKLPNNKGRFKRNQPETSTFNLNSLGLNLDLIYGIGKFSIEPQIYLDYYLPTTDTKRFTQLYSIVFGFSF